MSVDVSPRISAERVIIRMPSPDEAQTVVDYWVRNNEHLANSGPRYPDDFFTLEHWQEELQKNLEDFAADRSARMFVFEKSQAPIIIGNVALMEIVRRSAHFGYLGYGIAADKEGRGYMREAVSAVIKFGFEDLNMHRIMANYQPHNERSGMLLKRLGFTVEGYARDYLYINGKWCDHILTSLSNPNWVDKQA